MKFFNLETRTHHDVREGTETRRIHVALFNYKSKRAEFRFGGVIYHGSELLASKANVKALRALADALERHLHD